MHRRSGIVALLAAVGGTVLPGLACTEAANCSGSRRAGFLYASNPDSANVACIGYFMLVLLGSVPARESRGIDQGFLN